MTRSTFLPSSFSVKSAVAMKLRKVFLVLSNSTRRSISLTSVCLLLMNEPNNPSRIIPSSLSLSLFSESRVYTSCLLLTIRCHCTTRCKILCWQLHMTAGLAKLDFFW